MKKIFPLLIWLVLLPYACAAPGETAAQNTLTPTAVSPTEVPPTSTFTPTPEPSPTPVILTEDQLAGMTPDEILAAAPEIEGLTKSNISTVKEELVIYRDENGNAIKVFSLLTAQELSLPEAGIGEINLANGTKLEARAFTDSQEAVQFVADNSVWHHGDRQTVSAELKKEGVKDAVIGLNILVNVKNGRGIYPPYPEVDNENWFLIFILEIPDKNEVDSGLVLTFIDKNLGAWAIVLNDPNINDSVTSLAIEITGGMKLIIP